MSEISFFDQLKPFCVRAIENPSKEAFADLENVLVMQLKHTHIDLLPPFQEYLSFPMKMVLIQNNKFSEATSISALKALKSLFHLSNVTNWEFFSKTFVQLFTALSNPTCQIQDNKFSDELKLEIISCAQNLVSKTPNEIRSQMMDSAFCPALGHSIFVLLWISQNEKSRQLRITAMEVIMSMFKSKDGDDTLLGSSGNRLAAFLPGICIAMTEVATGDVKQGTAVTVMALKVWSFVVSLVMSDYNLSISNVKQLPTEVQELKVPEVERTPEWIEQTGSKLAILMQKIIPLASHEKWKVRLALLEWSQSILNHCSSSLEKHIHIPLDVVIILNMDEYTDVSSKSVKIFSEFSKQFSQLHKRDLISKLEENIFSLCTKLPRIFRVFDDNEKLSALNLLAGYIKLLGSRINCVLYSSTYINRLMLALMQLIQLDTSQVFILDNKLPSQLDTIALSTENLTWPKKYFKHFRNDKVYSNFCNVCKCLGSAGDISLLVDHLLEKAGSSSLHRKEAILILNEIISGVASSNKNEIYNHIAQIIDEYLYESFWNVEISESNAKDPLRKQLLFETDCITPEQIRSNILQKCLLIEGIANFSKVLNKEFEPLLLPVLCPLLEQVGSPCLPISHTASLALKMVSQSCQYVSTSDLIYGNSDYLAHCLSIKLSHFEDFPDAPVVLDVVFRLSEAQILPLLQDLLLKVLQLLDYHHNERAMQLLKVLQSLLTAIAKWKFPEDKPTPQAQSQSEDLDQLGLLDFLLEYHRLQQVVDNLEDTGTDDNPIENPDECPVDEQKKEKPKPLHIEMTLNVLTRCIHMQSYQSLPVRILTQDLIQQGVTILKYSEDDLLPMVHQLWPPLVRRFTNDDNVVTLKAFKTLMIMAEFCGDFIRNRTVTDVWSKLISILEHQRSVSVGKDEGSAYRFTIQYKLQLEILSNLGNLLQLLGIKESGLESACALAISYLCEKHPQTLIQAAKDTLTAAEKVDPDLVWFAIKNYGGSEPLPIPDKELRPASFNNTHPQMRKS